MNSFITIILITSFVTIVGGGLGYIIYMKTRPKKEFWKANVYQLGGGIKEIKKDSNGQIINCLQLKDLRPYATDILEKVPKKYGATIYKLKKLDITTNSVNADMVEVWNNGEKKVDVLISEGVGVVLEKGYDVKTSNLIYNPLPREVTETLKSEMLNKKDKLKQEKDILQAITPWIVAGIVILGLIAIIYLAGQSATEISKNLNEAMKYTSDKNIEAVEISKKSLEDNILLIINAKNFKSDSVINSSFNNSYPVIK